MSCVIFNGMTSSPAQKVIIRTVTHYYVGEVVPDHVGLIPGSIALRQCSWVPNTGRWSEALDSGTLKEVEPYPSEAIVEINVGAIVDLAPWDHELFKKGGIS